ncbi:MAG: PASTA domain-containing protein, partial [Acidimicrobiales bacterium]
ESPVPPRHHNIELPTAIEAIILKCLAKNPVNRYPTAEDLRADLRRFREGNRILAEPVMAPPIDPGATSVVAATTAVAAADGDGTGAMPTYYDDEDDEPRRSSGLFLAGLIVLLVLLAGMLYLLSQQFAGDGDSPDVAQVEVPNVIGETVENAQRILDNLGFEVDISEEANDDQEAGKVFDQTPKRGERVDEGSTIELKVSAGAEAIPVPDVIGSQVDQARLLLTAQGFTVRTEDQPDEDIPLGEVIDQDPGPNDDAPRGSEVVLFVSSGPAPREVPDVVGRTIAEASNLLGQAGFAVNQTSESSNDVPTGAVIRTDPGAGSVQPKGTAITVVVSSGPGESPVPSVINLTEANAINTLNAAGFTPVPVEQDTTDPTQNGRVIAQSPGANVIAADGSEVTITIGRFIGAVDGGV